MLQLGAVVGNFIDTNGVNHGFERSTKGGITKFDFPGAGTAAGQGTLPSINNASGSVVGLYIDGSGVLHGFLVIP